MNPRITGSLALLLASTALSALPAIAQDVGTAAAVNPLSKSTPPGGETRVLLIGARVVHKERVQTTAEGTVQLLFIDKTTLNIGPNMRRQRRFRRLIPACQAQDKVLRVASN